VDSIEKFNEISKKISKWEGPLAFDAEGVDLGRNGPLTLFVLKEISKPEEPAYVFDVLTIGEEMFTFFENCLLNILQSEEILKVTFDCRSDSDALFHQFGVELTNVLDLQVYDQAIRIFKGEPYPKRRGTFLPYVSGMTKVGGNHLTRQDFSELHSGTPPHKYDSQVWAKRPLSESSWFYSAADGHMIDLIYQSMEKVKITPKLRLDVEHHSKRYLDHFRRYHRAVRYQDKEYVMEEIAINRRDI